MKNENPTEVKLVLDGSFTVPQKFYDEIRELVTDIAPALLPDVKYTLQMLCGPDYWDSLTTGEPQSAGRCMVHMVENGLVPYDFAGWLCQSPKVYTSIK